MDRHALFIDAGYVVSAAGSVCLGASHRGEVGADWTALVGALESEVATTLTNSALLRTYWYDGSRNQKLSTEHELIATIPNVKLRLGRILEGRQKGVDSRLVRDMMNLAFHRSIATAVLLGGDDDLREGVVEAQDMGIRVILYGLPANPVSAQAGSLIREADQHVVLATDFWKPYFHRVISSGVEGAPGRGSVAPLPDEVETESTEEIDTGTPEATGLPQSSTPAAKSSDAATPDRESHGSGPDSGQEEEKEPPLETQERAYVVGFEYGDSFAARKELPELLKLSSRDPYVPSGIDAVLLKRTSRTLGSETVTEGLRRAARDGFWFAVHSAVAKVAGQEANAQLDEVFGDEEQ